jgi:hypothetical protein
MKNIFIKSISICIALTTLFSCTDYVSDSNVDPDEITESDARNLFQGILLADQFFHTSSNVRDVMIWMNQANGENRQYAALNDWNLSTASTFDSSWSAAYVNCLTNAKLTRANAEKELNYKLAGAAAVIEAHVMGTVTSMWGDVPYSDFDYTGVNKTPKFDKQADIYTSLQVLLDKAIVDLNKAGKLPADKDLYYAGSVAKWLKLAHSLKARYFLHTKQYANAKAEALLGISNASEDMIAVFGNSYLQSFNPYYSFLVYDRDDYMSGNGYAATLLDPSTTTYRGNAKTDESARFAFCYNTEYFSPYSLNIYSYDYFSNEVGKDHDLPDNGKFGSDSNMPLVTYGEMLLIISEVDARTSFGTGLASYNNYRLQLNNGYSIGCKNGEDGKHEPNKGYFDGSSDLVYKYAPYDATDFAQGGMENVTTTETDQQALLREIFEERYIYFMGTYECLNDFARSNNTAKIQLKTGKAGTPQRLLYSQDEINANPNTPNPVPSIVTKTPIHN